MYNASPEFVKQSEDIPLKRQEISFIGFQSVLKEANSLDILSPDSRRIQLPLQLWHRQDQAIAQVGQTQQRRLGVHHFVGS
jgi:hypothetical protein